jgi:hypothetical protein
MNTKYTPGPWQTGSGDCHTVYGPKHEGHQQIIARCPTQNGSRDYHYLQVLSNAKLIAAAPELLAALRALTTAAEHRDNTMGDPCRLLECKANLESAAKNARNIIAKATSD